jgi:hypothetical protein
MVDWSRGQKSTQQVVDEIEAAGRRDPDTRTNPRGVADGRPPSRPARRDRLARFRTHCHLQGGTRMSTPPVFETTSRPAPRAAAPPPARRPAGLVDAAGGDPGRPGGVIWSSSSPSSSCGTTDANKVSRCWWPSSSGSGGVGLFWGMDRTSTCSPRGSAERSDRSRSSGRPWPCSAFYLVYPAVNTTILSFQNAAAPSSSDSTTTSAHLHERAYLIAIRNSSCG